MHADEAGVLQQGAHGRCLVVAVLQQQPAACAQTCWRLLHDAPDGVEAIGAAGQRLQGFVAQGGQVRIASGDVGRVGDDGVKALRHAIEPVALVELHWQVQAPGVGARHVEGVPAVIQSVDLPLAAGLLQRQCDGAAAGAQVQQ